MMKGTDMIENNGQMNNDLNGPVNPAVDSHRYICTMDNSTFEGKRAIVNARNSALSLNGIGNAPLTIVGAYTARGVRAQTGHECVNVYLFASDGHTYFSQSQGIYRSVLDIYDMFPDFNSPDGIPVVVKEVALGGGRTTKSLEIK